MHILDIFDFKYSLINSFLRKLLTLFADGWTVENKLLVVTSRQFQCPKLTTHFILYIDVVIFKILK